MTTWNNPGYPPTGGYQQQPYPGGPQQPGYPPQPGYPGAPPQEYPGYPHSGYPSAQPGYPQSGYPSGQPGGYPQSGYPDGQPAYAGAPLPGFVPQAAGPYGQNNSNQSDMYGTPYEDDQDIKGFEFTDKTIRRGFIRKVYSILCVQLSVTLGFIAWFLFHTPTKEFVQRHPEIWIVSFVVMFVTLIAISCCGEVRRKSPANFILLGLFTLAESFMLGCTASRFDAQEVILAVGITAAVCLALTLFAFQTKFDFTTCSGFLFVAVIVLLLFGLLTIIFHSRILTLVYASVGALIFSFYLVYDTQMMMGGKHKYSLSPEEYIFAALSLYLDITRIFLYILTIIGITRN